MSNKVSIIIPNYNKECFIEDSLDSILAQTYQNWEVIIVDDGSTDDSLRIINQFVKKDKRFKCFPQNKTNNGGSVCRNIGLKNSSGDFIMFFDSDDLLASHCLKNRVNFMEMNQNLDFAVFSMKTFREKIGDKNFIWNPKKENALHRFLSHDLPWQTMQPFYRKRFLIKNNLQFSEDFPRMQDVEFHTKILLKEPIFEVYQGDPDCYFRVGLERKVFKPEDFYQKWAIAVEKYIEVFMRGQSRLFLGKTAIYGISEFIYAYRTKQLSKASVIMLSKPIAQVFSGFQKYMVLTYLFSALILPFHLPGHRAFFIKLCSTF